MLGVDVVLDGTLVARGASAQELLAEIAEGPAQAVITVIGGQGFLIGRGKDNPAQFLFYELFQDEAAFKAHAESAYFKTYIAEQALPLLAKRERTQYTLL